MRELGQIPDIPLIITGPKMWNTIRNTAMDGLQAARHDVLQNLAAQSEQGEFTVAEGSTQNSLSGWPDSARRAIGTVSGR